MILCDKGERDAPPVLVPISVSLLEARWRGLLVCEKGEVQECTNKAGDALMHMKWNIRRFGTVWRLFVASVSGTLVWVLVTHPSISNKLGRASLGTQRFPSTRTFEPWSSKDLPSPDQPVEMRPSYLPPALAEVTRIDPRGSAPEDRALLWNYLNQPGDDLPEKEADWLMGADEAMTWLRGAEGEASEVENGLVELALNSQRPLLLREYAIQHLGAWAEAHQAGPRVLDVLKALADGLPVSRLSALALAALFRSQFAHQEKEWISSISRKLAANTDGNPFVYCTALEVLGGLRHPDAEPLARRILQESSTVAGRVCALQMLGSVGDGATHTWLEARAQETEPISAEVRKWALQEIARRAQAGE